MKKIMLLSLIAMFLFGCLYIPAVAERSPVFVGELATDLDVSSLRASGYEVVDDRDSGITYSWPYHLDAAKVASESAVEGTLTSQWGQVGASFTYEFSGCFLALLFAEHHFAADIIISVDGKEIGRTAPYKEDAPVEDLAGGQSRVVFVTDTLSDGDHKLTVTHATAHNSGEDNLKPDGNTYYDNVALFDALIVKGKQSEVPVALEVGKRTSLYTDEVLTGLNLVAMDDTSTEFVYTWPYDLEAASIQGGGGAYGGTLHFNIGQVGARVTCVFRGSTLAIAFAKTYFACKVTVDVDGEIVGTFTPHADVRPETADVPYQSEICFVRTDLQPGLHILTLTHDTAYESGEDNLKPDGQKYYDNNAYFDCIFVQKEPDMPVLETETTSETVLETVLETVEKTNAETVLETDSQTASDTAEATDPIPTEQKTFPTSGTGAENDRAGGGCASSLGTAGVLLCLLTVGCIIILYRRRSARHSAV